MHHADEHPDDRGLLLGLDAELSDRRQAALDAHLAACPHCRARRARMEATLVESSEIYAHEFGSTAQGSGARDRLARALDDAPGAGARAWAARAADALTAPPSWATAGAALSLVLAFMWLSGSRGVGPLEGLQPAPVRSELPIAALTPGAASVTSAAALCTGARPSRLVPAAVREQVVRSYRMEGVPESEYELDALITPELGGSVDPRNLWPQRYDSPVWSARVKDELERLLPDLVCQGTIDLARAQRDIAADWVAAYKTYFRTNRPLQAHVGPAIDDDDLEIVPTLYALADTSPVPALMMRPGRGPN